MKPKKELGQNFLRDLSAVESLISASGPKKTDNYLEIGPGEGAVTQLLAPRTSSVLAVELDPELIPNLEKLSASFNNISIVNGDVLKILCGDASIRGSKINKVIGSIPYQITSPLLHSLAKLTLTISIESATLLIQKEVAKKITAGVPNASYLSNFVQTYFDVKYIQTVPKEYFYPVPKVDGAVVFLQPVGLDEKTSVVEPERWSSFLHKAFEHPRKMLRKVFDEKILKEAGIVPTQRPQEIGLENWTKLFNMYTRYRHSEE